MLFRNFSRRERLRDIRAVPTETASVVAPVVGSPAFCRIVAVGAMLTGTTLAGCSPALAPGLYHIGPLSAVTPQGTLAPASLSGATVSQSYQLVPGDDLVMHFPYRPTMDAEELVRPDGTVSAPIIGPVVAAGKTVTQFTDELRRRYADYMRMPPSSQRSYRIAAGDTLSVKFTYQPDQNFTAIVLPDGRVSLAMVGEITAEGQTPEQLQEELVRKYRPFLNKPDLVVIVQPVDQYYVADGNVYHVPIKDLDDATVTLKAIIPAEIYVAGEVATPKEVDLIRPVTALQAIAGAGGQLATADLGRVTILRRGSDAMPVAIVRDLAADYAGRADNDIVLQPFDVVIVPKTGQAQVAHVVDQYLYSILPQLKNISLGFSYTDLLNPTTVTVTK